MCSSTFMATLMAIRFSVGTPKHDTRSLCLSQGMTSPLTRSESYLQSLREARFSYERRLRTSCSIDGMRKGVVQY